jgi:hypothetical protein
MSSVFFPLSDCWGGGIVFIHDSSPTGSLVAKIPLDFLRKSGVNTWDFVLDIVNMLVDPVPNCPGMIESTEGDAVDLAAAPSEGQYVFKQAGAWLPSPPPLPSAFPLTTSWRRLHLAHHVFTRAGIRKQVQDGELG